MKALRVTLAGWTPCSALRLSIQAAVSSGVVGRCGHRPLPQMNRSLALGSESSFQKGGSGMTPDASGACSPPNFSIQMALLLGGMRASGVASDAGRAGRVICV